MQDHLTLGATYELPNKAELSYAYMHAFENSVNGRNSISSAFPPASFGGDESNIKMYLDSIGIAYCWKL